MNTAIIRSRTSSSTEKQWKVVLKIWNQAQQLRKWRHKYSTVPLLKLPNVTLRTIYYIMTWSTIAHWNSNFDSQKDLKIQISLTIKKCSAYESSCCCKDQQQDHVISKLQKHLHIFWDVSRVDLNVHIIFHFCSKSRIYLTLPKYIIMYTKIYEGCISHFLIVWKM